MFIQTPCPVNSNITNIHKHQAHCHALLYYSGGDDHEVIPHVSHALSCSFPFGVILVTLDVFIILVSITCMPNLETIGPHEPWPSQCVSKDMQDILKLHVTL